MLPVEFAVVSALGQAIAFLGAAIAAASIFIRQGATLEVIRKAASRGLAAVAAGMLIQALATTSLIVVPPVAAEAFVKPPAGTG